MFVNLVIIGVSIPIAAVILIHICFEWDRIMRWWRNDGSPSAAMERLKTLKKEANMWIGNTYTYTNKDGLLPDERRKPPKATFFSNISGEAEVVEGEYEEKYLNSFELKAWEKRKEEKTVGKEASESKNLLIY